HPDPVRDRSCDRALPGGIEGGRTPGAPGGRSTMDQRLRAALTSLAAVTALALTLVVEGAKRWGQRTWAPARTRPAGRVARPRQAGPCPSAATARQHAAVAADPGGQVDRDHRQHDRDHARDVDQGDLVGEPEALEDPDREGLHPARGEDR